MIKTILIFGAGYVTKFLSAQLSELGWVVYCTSRNPDHKKLSLSENVKIIDFYDPNLKDIIIEVDAVLSSVPTDDKFIDPVLEQYGGMISKAGPKWIGYLSSTGVYGDHNGDWVDEQTKCKPTSLQSELRLLAEEKWLELYSQYQLPIHIFRLSGIYGPGRNCLEEINNGKDFTVVKKDQYFSRIHVMDICKVIISSINFVTPGEIYNVSDNEPAPVNVVQQFGASLLNKDKLKEIPFEDANLSKQALIFFNDNKKVSNAKIIKTFNIELDYPNYRIGLSEILKLIRSF